MKTTPWRLAALALPALASAPLTWQHPPTQEAVDAAPARGIAGLAGFRSRSSLRLSADPDHPHSLETHYGFPDRARWRFAAGDKLGERQRIYRFGTHLHQVLPNEEGSRPVDAKERNAVLLQLELRRAALLFPDGFAWEPFDSGPSQSASSAPVKLCVQCEERAGSLSAELDVEGRATRITALHVDGEPVETLRIDSWQEREGRLWPRELVLEKDDAVVWHETLEEIDTRVFSLDAFFLPADVRRARGVVIADGLQIFPVDLKPVTLHARALPEGTSWTAARELARSWIAESELDLDPVPTFEVADDGSATAVLLRLADAVEDPPADWTTLPERPGLGAVVSEMAGLNSKALALLQREAPAGAPLGRPYARILERPGQAPSAQLYLPLVP